MAVPGSVLGRTYGAADELQVFSMKSMPPTCQAMTSNCDPNPNTNLNLTLSLKGGAGREEGGFSMLIKTLK